jgi:hypothetical protein
MIASISLALILLASGTIFLQSPAVAQPAGGLVIIDGGVHDISLKAIQDKDGNVELEDDFEILAEDVVTVQQFEDISAASSVGVIEKAKAIDSQLRTIPLEFSNNIVNLDLPAGSYLLDIVVLMDNGDNYAYETVLVVLEPGQVLDDDDKRDIIQSFVTVSIDIKIIFRNGPVYNNGTQPTPTPPVGNITEPEPPLTNPVEPDPEPNGTSTTPEPIHFEGPEPIPCEPGADCPPCFENVEADWCQDDDERDDIDECILHPELCDVSVAEEPQLAEEPEVEEEEEEEQEEEPEEEQAADEDEGADTDTDEESV